MLQDGCWMSDYTIIGTQTPYYRDNIDSKSGGCQISWGLKTVDQPWEGISK
jgi:hypothetical protein